jgi:hypothetical protein
MASDTIAANNATSISIQTFIIELIDFLKSGLGIPDQITFKTYISSIKMHVAYAMPL